MICSAVLMQIIRMTDTAICIASGGKNIILLFGHSHSKCVALYLSPVIFLLKKNTKMSLKVRDKNVTKL